MSGDFQLFSGFSQQIWDMKYRLRTLGGTPQDRSIADTWRRVAEAAASSEKPADRKHWSTRFEQVMADFSFLPAGRILAGAGSGRHVTLFNCFVMGRIEDDLASIFENVKEAALTMQQGGGIGHDFSTLRPKGALVRSIGADASGPISFMDVWDAMCRTIMSAGARRGAMMGTLRCDHPDIEAFIEAKSDAKRLRMFNLSVLVTDAFVEAIKGARDWDLVFGGKIYRTLRARDLWRKIMRATYDYAEPGVIFIDRVNGANNLAYCERIEATNPCGEQPLPPYGACLLGSVNLARLVDRPFEDGAALNEERLEKVVGTAIRFLDNVIEVSRYPLPQQKAEAEAKRRIGLGVTGLADALIMCKARYGSPQSLQLAERWMMVVERAAYLASSELAGEKGPFPLYDKAAFANAPGVARLPPPVLEAIARQGMRNGLVTSIAPTGTISLLAGNVSSGVEPVFDFTYERRVLAPDGTTRSEAVEDFAHRLYRHTHGPRVPLPDYFVTAGELAPQAHLAMQAALQRHVDSSISKTINCPADMPFEAFEGIYLEAHALGLKGCTTFRPNSVTGSILSSGHSAGHSAAVRPGSESHGAAARATTSPAARAPVAPGLQSSLPLQSSPPPWDGEFSSLTRPLQRDPVLAGFTYKLRWPDSDHAMYVTMNDIMQDGQRRPFEIFINSKNLEHYAWTVALTRMISAVFRRGGDISFVVEELKAVFDPRGGHWVGGRYVPSLLAAIGEIIETHMVSIGFLASDTRTTDLLTAPEQGEARTMRHCPRCQQPALVQQEGCLVCRACGYSKCG